MSSLAHLFVEDSSERATSAPVAASPEESQRVEELFDKPRIAQVEASAPLVDDTAALQALVGGRGRAVSMGGGPVSGPTRVRREGNHVDALNVVVAVLAVLALIVASIVAGVVIASSSPETDALRTLSQTEAVLANDTQAVNAEIGRVDQARADGIAHAQQLTLPLEQLAGMSDNAALSAAETARGEYLTALEELVVPPTVEPYVLPPVDEESLSSIGAAIDEVATRSTEVSAIADEVADLRTQVFALDRSLAAAMATFAATVPTSAAVIVAENPDAEDSFRQTVTETADAVAASALATPASIATLPAYSTAVTALRADQERAEIAIAEQLAWEEEQRRLEELRRQQSVPQPDPVTDPPVDPPVDPDAEG